MMKFTPTQKADLVAKFIRKEDSRNKTMNRGEVQQMLAFLSDIKKALEERSQ